MARLTPRPTSTATRTFAWRCAGQSDRQAEVVQGCRFGERIGTAGRMPSAVRIVEGDAPGVKALAVRVQILHVLRQNIDVRSLVRTL